MGIDEEEPVAPPQGVAIDLVDEGAVITEAGQVANEDGVANRKAGKSLGQVDLVDSDPSARSSVAGK